MQMRIIQIIRHHKQTLIAIVIGIILALLMGEGITTLYGYYRFNTLSVQELYERNANNTFITDIQKTNNTYMDTLFPHPYLAFVHRNGYGIEVNNVGLLGDDYPFEKSKDSFVVLVTGGSVASQFVQLKRGGIKYLQDILNERYDFNGKRVIVLNGGDGAWHQPQQSILFLLYLDVIDAVITLDGFNEHYVFRGPGRRIEIPANNFHHVNPFIEYGYERLVAAWMANSIYQFFQDNFILSRSHLAWFTSKMLGKVMRKIVYQNANVNMESKTTIEGIFSLPGEWDDEKCFAYNIAQYRKYIRIMNTIAQEYHILRAFFIQPVPGIKKSLTEEEQAVVGNLDYVEPYQRMTTELLQLQQENIPIFDLLDVFSRVDDTVYADPIHCVRYGELNESVGYKIMAERIANILEKEWKLTKK